MKKINKKILNILKYVLIVFVSFSIGMKTVKSVRKEDNTEYVKTVQEQLKDIEDKNSELTRNVENINKYIKYLERDMKEKENIVNQLASMKNSYN